MAPVAAPERPDLLPPLRERRRCERRRPGRSTLADRLARVADELASAGTAACPLCDGELETAQGEATCRGCDSRFG